MREEEILSIIKTIIGGKYIGDDCAYLKDLGIVISQDSLVEDVHFSLKYTTPYQLGYKSAMVNISDISASGGRVRGKYMTVALSLPENITNEFIKEFYTGLNDALKECGDMKVVGGDITGSDKIMISVTVIGTTEDRKISSRSNAQTGQAVVVSGEHGSSALGLRLLQTSKNIEEPLYKNFVHTHLMPKAQVEFADKIALNIKEDYAMMDSSDGLADALYKIAQASDKTIVVDFDKILFNPKLKEFAPKDYRDMILFGGEDYQIVATVPGSLAKMFDMQIIGYVTEPQDNIPVKIINYDGGEKIINNLENCYNHFKK